jgi:hypothetical protein
MAGAGASAAVTPASQAWRSGEVVLAAAAVDPSPAVAVFGRGQGWWRVCHLSAHSVLRLLSPTHLPVLTGLFPGWRGDGGGVR